MTSNNIPTSSTSADDLLTSNASDVQTTDATDTSFPLAESMDYSSNVGSQSYYNHNDGYNRGDASTSITIIHRLKVGRRMRIQCFPKAKQ